MLLHPATGATLIGADCLAALRKLPAARFDSVVTDPPYELGFMGKSWDASGIAYSVELWREVLRVLKPGGHLLAFGATRTYHRMACAIEDAGFEVRDSLHWLYGTGFPKSLNVSKAIETGGSPEAIRRAAMGDAYEPSGRGRKNYDHGGGSAMNGAPLIPSTDAARQWAGWGTALKPGHEPIVMARKPLEGTVAENVQRHGTGAINVDGCRIATEEDPALRTRLGCGAKGKNALGYSETYDSHAHAAGRWPANVLLDEHAAAELDAQSGVSPSNYRESKGSGLGYHGAEGARGAAGHADSGGASRFFYVAKPSRAERDLGCDHLPKRSGGEATERADDSAGVRNPRAGANRGGGAANYHPTVKPIALMRHLVRLVTPPGGVVLDPFVGSGTTGIAARLEGLRFVGIEREREYLTIAEARIRGAA